MNEVMRPKPEPGAERHEHAAQGDGERARRVCCDLPRAHLDSGEQEEKEDAKVRGNLEEGARGQVLNQGDRDGRASEQGERDAGRPPGRGRREETIAAAFHFFDLG
jgi:hypothetical protein